MKSQNIKLYRNYICDYIYKYIFVSEKKKILSCAYNSDCWK